MHAIGEHQTLDDVRADAVWQEGTKVAYRAVMGNTVKGKIVGFRRPGFWFPYGTVRVRITSRGMGAYPYREGEIIDVSPHSGFLTSRKGER